MSQRKPPKGSTEITDVLPEKQAICMSPEKCEINPPKGTERIPNEVPRDVPREVPRAPPEGTERTTKEVPREVPRGPPRGPQTESKRGPF